MKSKIVTDNDGNKFWMLPNTSMFHRENGPAAELSCGGKHWYINGQRHREDGPAVIAADGREHWYINGQRHREDGPAIIDADGHKEWWVNGERHREDGPATEYPEAGYKEWWVNDIQYTEQRHKHKMRSKKIKKLLNV